MRASSLNRPVFLMAVALAAIQSLPAGPVQQADIETEGGVRIVRNPATPVKGPDGKVATVSLAEDLVIGNDTSREDYWFGFVNSLAVDGAGRIFTLDPKVVRIRVFGPDGRLVRAFGQKGQGPGELRGPGSIVVAPDGSLVVLDVLNHRMSAFTSEGKPLKDESFGLSNIAEVVRDTRANRFGITVVRGEQPSWELVKLDPSLKPVLKLHALPFARKPGAWSGVSIRLFLALAGEDRFAWMAASDYLIHVIDASGKEVLRIFKDSVPRKITSKDRDELIKSSFPEGVPPQLEIDFPESFPAASAFMTDEKGRIFVRTYETDGKAGVAMDVFSPDGLYIARLFVPENEDAETVRNDRLYTIVKEPESGNPLVKRYALKWSR
jgi:hypothetical protein